MFRAGPRRRPPPWAAALGALALASAAQPAAGGSLYVMSDNYLETSDFFSKFSFFEGPDPTRGFVEFLGYDAALEAGIVNATEDRVYMGTDTTHKAPTGRRSVRIASRATYQAGLFIIRLDHLPTGCGTWPAYWMFGQDADHQWPTYGEFDIIEGVHRSTQTSSTLHTTEGCDQSATVAGRDFSTEWNWGDTKAADDCYIHGAGQWWNQGCSQLGLNDSMGPTFNQMGGGTYAAEWDPTGGYIRTWFWRSGTEPRDIGLKEPDPSSWGMPYSFFGLSASKCQPGHFKDMRVVFDLTFCGELAGPLFAASCPEAAGMTCEEFVAQHPENMTEAYWSIRTLEVYQQPMRQWMVFDVLKRFHRPGRLGHIAGGEEINWPLAAAFFALAALILAGMAAMICWRRARRSAKFAGRDVRPAFYQELSSIRGPLQVTMSRAPELASLPA
mmetsp:Transcript_38441/g.108726  ORF Transcript_38441/g.108726 Transcript_38441/m.108726 type:complete len:442 (-) Transcript_38441:30-1355(-)